ncbi:SusC/RagA family TonB-linked outer membrane protein [Dyadobacter luticola]|uniref:SusC/RagA family TonB-linked outer membrane protein n=1 Tax=Dyadobacter luticola TaxID=1979387 RepID=A0A5R9L685_9BACT|nr:SusC/RagA family TonB-linked outer membrane protein [Dyadobacter luticola]TLV03755.1 SusC/RagA family TonB-linked outer membrane protein [Dyadobacter luticola]
MKKGFTKCLLRVTLGGLLALFQVIHPAAGATKITLPEPSRADKSVTGKVLSKDDNTPVPGVTVIVKGTTTGTTTDIDGKYQINVADGSQVLVFSAVGFLTQEKEIGNASVVDIILATDQKTLDEVVVVGYGTLKKRDLTGAVSQINATKLDNENPQSVQDVLRGNIPGMNVGFSASAKGGGNVAVRGVNSLTAGSSPLVVLDGAIYYGGLEDINPNDIETVDVLKDASSAAVFGAKAASGVILVTTKKGKEGKTLINVNTNFGFSEVAKNQPVLSPDGFLTWRAEVMRNINASAQPSRFTNPNNLPSDVTLDQWLAFDGSAGDPETVWLQRLGLQSIEIQNYKAGKSVDWYSKVFQKAFRQDHTVSLSGKNDRVTYYMSLGYLSNEGIVVGDKYSTVRARVNLEGKVNKFLSVGLSTQFASRDESQVPVDYNFAANLSPWGSEFNPDGTYKWRPNEEASGGNHPNYAPSFTDRDKGSITVNNVVFAKIALPFGISYQANFTPRYEFSHRYNAESSKSMDWVAEGGRASRRDTRTLSWQLDNIFKWNKTIAQNHNIDATFLINAERFRMWDDSISNKGFAPNDNLGYHNMGAGNAPIMWSNDETSTADALMGRLFYSFKDRYMVTLSTRRDGYSAFGQKNPRALFSSAALGWVFTDEPFLKNNIINYGKLRVSYGSNGNRDIGRYDALSNLATGKYLHVNPAGTVYQVSQLYVDRMANPNLKWERTNSLNFGFDFSLFNSLIDGSLELYKSSTHDLLVRRALPNVLGFDYVLDNLGQVDNKGIELSLNSTNIKKDNLTWRTTLNMQMNRNKIVHLYGTTQTTTDANGNTTTREADDITNRWFIGHAVDEIWNYKVLGVWQTEEADAAAKYGVKPGDHKILDVNNDGKYTNDDKVFQGFTSPRVRLTLRNEFKVYKNWDASFMVYSYLGQKGEFNQTKNRQGFPDRSSSYVLPYWTAENRNNEWARLYSSEGSATGYTYYKSKSFLRFESIALAYTLPKQLVQKIAIQNLRIYGNVRNLGYISGWDFWDPENGTNNSNNTNLSVSVPSPRIFTIGLDITL